MALTYLGEISEKLKTLSINKSNLSRGETAISKMIFKHLKNNGLKVTNEKQIGFLKFYVDVDYKDGRACVEIKLAKKLVDNKGNTGEMQRLLGQTFYFTKNYRDRSPFAVPVVMVLVIGDKNLQKDPKIKEIKKHVKALGAEFKYLLVA